MRNVERRFAVGRQDRQAAEILHALQQVIHFDIGVAVVAVLDLRALAEQGIGLVEEQDRAAALGGREDAAQVALGLADIFADDAGEIDAIEIEPQVAREHLGRHGLAGAARAGEQRADAAAAVELGAEAPALIDAARDAPPGRRSPAIAGTARGGRTMSSQP